MSETLAVTQLQANRTPQVTGTTTIAEKSSRLWFANKDRLARFGFELIQWMAQQNGSEVLVLNDTGASPKGEFTQDILSILDTFSCRLHGLRRYRQAIKERYESIQVVISVKSSVYGWMLSAGSTTRQ